MSVTVNRVTGLRELRDELKALDPKWPRAMRAAHLRIADKAAGWARAEAQSGTRMQRAAADAIVGTGGQASAAIGIATSGHPFANVAFWGEKRHTGWYADPRYHDSPPQGPPWVGASWEAASTTEGPYAINTALAKHLDDIVEVFSDEIGQLVAQAFPD